jgi:hypothetical protein
MAIIIKDEIYKKHSDVPLPGTGDSFQYRLGDKSRIIFLKNSDGKTSIVSKTTEQQAELKQEKVDMSKIKSEDYSSIFSLIFTNAVDESQSLRLMNAYNKYTSIDLAVKTKNFVLAKQIVDMMLLANDITSDDKTLINKYLNLGARVL